eukprot:NODE_25263_length_593_cov_3.884120.p4 GENE.NODE_25263_length_593_cov_3.884120~~NODE_25263_length_593_cov_3.884120.p4  ORF type:complete len:73 (-),score=7.81 NODE_25263_length_593_cov_3.884120:311-529(-)
MSGSCCTHICWDMTSTSAISRRQLVAKKRYVSTIGKWVAAVTKPRAALGVKGFMGVKKGTALYNKAKSFYKN